MPGRRLAYLEAGEGAALLFVHAFPLTAEMWRPQLETLAPGWRGLAPDLRGLGRSALAAGDRQGRAASSMEDHADDLDALLGALRIDSAVVVGLSMGGYVAFALCRRAPQRVRALVLADTRAEPDTDEGRAKRDSLKQMAREHGAAAIADAMVPQIVGSSTQKDRPELLDDVGAMARQNSPDGLIDALECLKSRQDSRPLLPALTCPTLIIVGAEDQVTTPAMSEAMACAIPGAAVHVIAGAGHLCNLEQPEAFGRSLHQFLDRLDA
ncbi:MAG: alpha/beta fold hydrolase [Luteitalea sp.]|nr:alpha/beta fold hydrolase [Luteitalea sp.]